MDILKLLFKDLNLYLFENPMFVFPRKSIILLSFYVELKASDLMVEYMENGLFSSGFLRDISCSLLHCKFDICRF